MSRKNPRDTTVTSLSIPPETLAGGKKKAVALRRSFSNYVTELVDRDIASNSAIRARSAAKEARQGAEHAHLGLEGKNHPRRERAASESRREKGTK